MTDRDRSFPQAEIAWLGELAVRRWPSQSARPHAHVLAPELAAENLLDAVRGSALDYFRAHDIRWWLSSEEQAERARRGLGGGFPTGHLNSSQVVCVNHLEPARVDRELALNVARNLVPDAIDVREIDEEPEDGANGYVAFEWIGDQDYLGEAREGAVRVRGANVTSVDALIRLTLDDGTQALLVIEWKYLECYGGESVAVSKPGTDRVKRYRTLIERPDSPFLPGESERLFYEPYYQLMRQTLLAWQAAADPKMPETTWLHRLVVPAGNLALRCRVPEAAPKLIGDTLEEAWKSALKEPERFRVVTPTEVVEGVVPAGWQAWRHELAHRYLT